MKARWKPSEFETLKTFWPTQGSKAVAEMLGRSWKAVQKKALRSKVLCDQQSLNARRGLTIANANDSCDTSYFEREWSPNQAYILGYIFADGCLTKGLYSLSLLCHSKDEEILLAIQQELKSTHKVSRVAAKVFPNGRSNGPRTSINVSSSKLVHSLVNRFGLCHRKTYVDLSMPTLPESMFGHFFRGYFDGDGHVSMKGKYGRISFVGTRRFVEQMQTTVCSLTGALKTKLQRQGNIYSVGWGCHQDLITIHRLMYPPGRYIFLKRKRDTFDRVVQQNLTRLVRSHRHSMSLN